MKVVFRPSVEEHVEFLANRQKQSQSTSSNAVTWIFFVFNLAIVPGFLVFRDLVWPAFAIFAFNALVMIVLLSRQQTGALRKYYQDTWPQLEEYDCEIGIDENGVDCKHAGNRNSYLWKNVRSIGTTDTLVFFDVGPTHVLVSKRGFANGQEASQFVESANKHKQAAGANQE